MILIKIPYDNSEYISSNYSIEMVFRKCPPQVSTPNSDLPKRWKNGAVEGGSHQDKLKIDVVYIYYEKSNFTTISQKQ